jgi:hypothetical protein
MTFRKRDLKTIYAALHAAIRWEESLAEAYDHMKKDPAYGKARRTAKKYGKLSRKIYTEIFFDPAKKV